MRWESATPDSRGRHVGIFGLANGLGRRGLLAPADHDWWRSANDWFNSAYVDPNSVASGIFAAHPSATCWFKTTATHLIERIPPYLALLDRYSVAWRERLSDAPGRVIYEDEVQVVVVEAEADSDR